MCWTSAYYIRCKACKQDLDHRLEVDDMCSGKRKGRNVCTYIYPVKVNVQWLDWDNCLVCTAKKDLMMTLMQEIQDREEQQRKEQEAKEQQQDEEDSEDELIRKQLVNDEEQQMHAEKHGRIEEWLEGL
ncbi:hypothetical protein ACLX1H_005025 [Fusarium chlamydosporum]